ncbi:hypothetical protein CWM47_01280 [Spirosoma pollinicola]|uniref:Uncharacterized protein n=1 Tax=Spirosoma pollinicola TaxID=2057025 RepID=A0A2K8YSJ6_9BACT|nr:hypothetical protein CWM47_01280 [Spirosoma pollinicola]
MILEARLSELTGHYSGPAPNSFIADQSRLIPAIEKTNWFHTTAFQSWKACLCLKAFLLKPLTAPKVNSPERAK